MSPESGNLYQEIARVLEYPDETYQERVRTCEQMLGRRFTDGNVNIERFRDFVRHATPHALEELYVQTFDVQSICCLDVGYVMFGEDYRRGQFMAQLKMLEKSRGVDCGSELPDFLPNILRLMPALKYQENQSLVEKILAPALDKMLVGFAQDGNIYREPLAALREMLREDYGS